MLYHIFYPLKVYFSPLNILGYITFRSIMAILCSLILCYIIGKILIPYLRKKQFVQIIRTDGPKTHLKKSGTPTMGGLIILISIILSTLLWARLNNRFIIIILISVLWLGLIGFFDDYVKIIKKNPKGISANQKLLMQLLLAIGIGIYLYYFPSHNDFRTKINIPYLKDVYIDLGIFYILFVILIIVGSSNAVNLTDGLDGLAIGCLIVCALTYAILSYSAGHFKVAQYLKIIYVGGSGELSVFLASVLGAGLGFLWFNCYPADIFMGDSGSLFLGGSLGIIAVFIKHELILIIIGGIFVIEAVSVILQVYSYKRYKKRIFLMAPLHHHFEIKGLSESKITIRCWIINIVLALLALSSLKIR